MFKSLDEISFIDLYPSLLKIIPPHFQAFTVFQFNIWLGELVNMYEVCDVLVFLMIVFYYMCSDKILLNDDSNHSNIADFEK